MRVIAGEFKGHTLKMPKGPAIRPTTDMVKEALFSILGNKISGADFLELFAGSGNIGIEAKSRGAKTVVFVEHNHLCLKTMEENLSKLKIDYSYGLNCLAAERELAVRILPCSVQRALKILSQEQQRFSLIFLDPPYYQGMLKISLLKVSHYDILKPHSWVIAEHNKAEILPQVVGGLKVKFIKRYGDSSLSFYQKEVKR